jgi:hypothetical protein
MFSHLTEDLPMEYSLKCECGNQIAVSETSAGTKVDCTCGRTLSVPSLRRLRGFDTGPSAISESLSAAAQPHVAPGLPTKAILPPQPDENEAEKLTATMEDLAAAQSAGLKDAGRRNMAIGGLICVVGLLITIATYSAAASGGGGRYVIAWGAVVAGGIQFFRGVRQSNS